MLIQVSFLFGEVADHVFTASMDHITNSWMLFILIVAGSIQRKFNSFVGLKLDPTVPKKMLIQSITKQQNITLHSTLLFLSVISETLNM